MSGYFLKQASVPYDRMTQICLPGTPKNKCEDGTRRRKWGEAKSGDYHEGYQGSEIPCGVCPLSPTQDLLERS